MAERVSAEGAEIIGVGRYEPTEDDGVAKVAFVVEDGWQGRGVGTRLLARVLDAGEGRGVHRFCAYVLAGNRRMLGLIGAHAHVDRRKTEDGVTAIHFSRRPAAG